MKIKFISQGTSSNNSQSVGNVLIELLRDTHFHSLKIISAFTSKSAIKLLKPLITGSTSSLKSVTILTGIDEGGTSKEALEALLELPFDAYIFYQSASQIFHPKIYFLEGDERFEIIVGSSNLTQRGLFQNIETSLWLSGSKTEDYEVADEVPAFITELFNYEDSNLKKITQELIDELVRLELVPTESEIRANRASKTNINTINNRQIIRELFPSIKIPKIPLTTPRQIQDEEATGSKIQLLESEKTLVWISSPLTERDLNIPKGENTHPTGSMLFKKGAYEDIDPRHYFREYVFSKLAWKHDESPKTSHYERANATFTIIVNGVNHGDHELSLSHNSRTDSLAYLQKNLMTSISWGSTKSFIRDASLIGGTLLLYTTSPEKQRFTIEIISEINPGEVALIKLTS